jgi:sugar lactone lactonase YvrE
MRRAACTLVAIAASLSVIGSAGADPTGYSANKVDQPGFYAIDLATGAATLIGPMPQVNGLAFAPDGRLFGVVDTGTDSLVTIDPTTAAVTPIGPLNLPSGNDVLNTGLTFGADGRLWMSAGASTGQTSFNEWYELDPATGQALGAGQVLLQGLVGDPNERVFALAARCDGAIFGMDGDEQLYQIDPDAALATAIGAPANAVTIPSGIDFASDGALWGITFGANADTNPSQVFRIDPATGAISDLRTVAISGTNTSTFSGLAVASTPASCPTAVVFTPTFTG